MIRRAHYSTALAQAQGIFNETITLFDLWEEGMGANDLFEKARAQNVLGSASERRLRNIVLEGFASRYLREPMQEATPTLKALFCSSANTQFLQQLNLLYAARQHGILFDFITDEYWSKVAVSSPSVSTKDIGVLIDKGLLTGKLKKNWSPSVRKRVSSYVLGAAADLGLLGSPSAGRRPIEYWRPLEELQIYLAYDLHFYGFSDDEIVASEEWQLLGLSRNDVSESISRLQQGGHWIAQDTGHLIRIEWNYKNRKELIDALNS